MPDTIPRKRRWRKIALIVLIPIGLVALAIALLPVALGTGPGREFVLERINRGFDPGRVDFQGLELSWFRPTKLTGFSLKDPRGTTVAASEQATLSPNLWQLITDAPKLGTLTLHKGKLDIERSADGTIDLYEALRSVLQKRNPARDLTIRVEAGTLRLRDPGFAETLNADPAEVEVRIPQAPHPLTWHVQLVQTRDGKPTRLEISGDLDRWGTKQGGKLDDPELHLAVIAKEWRLAVNRSGVVVQSSVDGSIDALRRAGRWSTQGDLKAGNTLIGGDRLGGESLALERLTAAWTLGQEESGWSVRRLDVTSPVGTIRSSGTLNLDKDASGHQTIEANLDLAALAKNLPHTLRLRDDLALEKGTASLKLDAELRPNSDLALRLDAGLRDLSAKRAGRTLSLREPVRFDAKGGRFEGVWRLDTLAFQSSFLNVEGSGRPSEAVAFKGSADLRALQSQVGDWLDLTGVEMSGHSTFEGTYKVTGPDYGLDLKTDLRDLRVETNKLPAIARPTIALETKVGGPADAGGLPSGWTTATAKIRSADYAADFQVRPKDQALNVVASVKAPLGSGENAPRGEIGLDADWDRADRTVRFARLDLGARANNKGDRPTWAGLSTSGVLDLNKGELRLNGGKSDAPSLIALGPDGLQVSGLGGPATELRIDGSLTGDLAALESALQEWADRVPRQVTGRWTLLAQAGGASDGTNISTKLHVDALNWPSKAGEIGEPWPRLTLSAQAVHNRAEGRVELTELAAVTPVAVLQASGRLDLKEDARYIDLKGTLTPDWEQFQTRLTQRLDPDAKFRAAIKPFSVRGPIRDGSTWTERLRSLDADLALDLQELDVYGLRMGAAPIAVRSRDGKVQIEPIVTTLNEGHVRLEPELDLDAPEGPTLRLGKNSIIRDAEINDEVSHRFLRYVAPVLDQATKVNGMVTIDIDRAEFPLGPGFGRKTLVEGAIVFDNVEFGPGPMMDQLLTMMGRREKVVRLDEPVHLSIAEGRIRQRGFALPIGNVTRLEMEGWVDFQRNMAMVASFPITPTMLGNNNLLADITAGAKIQVPITGTLDKPKIDDDLFKKQLAETGKGILMRGGPRLAAEILSRIANRPAAVRAVPPPPLPEIVPADPGLKKAEGDENANAPKDPPRMTAAERKAKQLEKRNERRKKRGLPPLP